MRKLAAMAVATAAGATIGRRVFAQGTPARRMLRKGTSRGAQQLRYASGRLKGVEYRISGGHPDPDVPDAVLADRVRSQLGNLERRLDVPHVHVMVNDHVVTLHGDVSSEDDAKQIEGEVLDVSGVRGIQSFLHVGLIAGDSRPSEGRTVDHR
jgi:osmotically-inducible protein OsmY